MSNMCPVCGYTGLETPPYLGKGGIPYSGADGRGTASSEICASCGFQFGFTDQAKHITHQQWREQWIANGMQWRIKEIKPPPDWNPVAQLRNIGVTVRTS